MTTNAFAGVDIGGSHIGFGVINLSTNLVVAYHEEALDATKTPEEIVDKICDYFKCQVNFNILAIGIGCPGQSKNGILVAASNLPTFKNTPLVAMVRARMNNIPAILLNDADAAIAAEVWGQPNIYKNHENIAMITLGTGVGFGLILNGNLYQGSNGLIEGGHMILNQSPDARQCGCGQRGCAEVYASAANTARRYSEKSLLVNGELLGIKTESAKDVFDRATNGDPIAQDIIDEVISIELLHFQQKFHSLLSSDEFL